MQAGTYVVVLTLEADGGSASDSITITVEPSGLPIGPREQLEGVPPPTADDEEEAPVEEQPVEEAPPAPTEEEEAGAAE